MERRTTIEGVKKTLFGIGSVKQLAQECMAVRGIDRAPGHGSDPREDRVEHQNPHLLDRKSGEGHPLF